jgi:transcription termination factor Rho
MNLQRLKLETTRQNLLLRFIDLLAPIAKGQRGLIIGPQHLGEKLILEAVASSLAVNHPEVVVMAVLLDQHQDEVSAAIRCFKAEVFSSTWHELEAHHIGLAENVMTKAQSLLEQKRDVLILMDSLTRLAQAYGKVLPLPDRTEAGTHNPYVLRQIKRLLNAACKPGAGGSLTMLAIAEVEIEIPWQEMFLEDLKSTVEIQIVLEHGVAREGIFPAVNIHRSRNKDDTTFIAKEEMARICVLRKVLEPLSAVEAAKLLGSKLLLTRSNEEFLNNMSAL